MNGPEKGVHGPEKGGDGRDNAAPGQIATAGQIAEDKGLDGPQGQGNVHGQEFAQVPPTPGGFVEKEIAREKAKEDGNASQNELARGRVLPDEQLENDKGRGR